MGWILKLALFLLLALVAALAGFVLRRDAGQVYLQFHGWEVETTVVFLLIALAALALAIYLLYLLLVRWPREFGWSRQRRAVARLEEGLILAYEGKYYAAERAMSRATADRRQQLLALLAAAGLAHRRGDRKRWEQYLQKAARNGRGRRIANLLGTYWRRIEGDPAAEQELAELARREDLPPILLQARIDDLVEAGRASDALPLLQRLDGWRQLGDREFAQVEARVMAAAFEQVADAEQLASLWQDLSRALRKDPRILRAIGRAEQRLGGGEVAVEAAEASLGREWCEELADVYAELPGTDCKTRIKRGEAYLRKHPESPGLLLALARWCRLDGIYGKAGEYLRMALSLRCDRMALIEAARLAEACAEPERARLAWRLAAECPDQPPGADDLAQLLRGNEGTRNRG